MAQKKETTFKKRVLEDLKTVENIWFFKSNEVSVRGILDIIVCARGNFVAIELKATPQDKPDALQLYNAEKIKACGGVAMIAHPDNWHEVLMQLRMLAS